MRSSTTGIGRNGKLTYMMISTSSDGTARNRLMYAIARKRTHPARRITASARPSASEMTSAIRAIWIVTQNPRARSPR